MCNGQNSPVGFPTDISVLISKWVQKVDCLQHYKFWFQFYTFHIKYEISTS